MSDIFDIPLAANNYRLLGYRDFLDEGTGNARIEFYRNTRPAVPGDPAGDDPALIIVLAKPSGSIVSNKLRLTMDDPGGYMALLTGDLVWGRAFNGDDAWAGDGDASDESGDGVFKVAGTDGTNVYAGGYVVLGTTALE